jgi:multiple sugar transport system ATP-binding protein
MRAQLTRLHERLGITTIYVTHDQVEAMTLGQRVAVLRGGVLQQCDTPQRLYECPSNIFVAEFIGSPAMNLYAAMLARDGDSLQLGSQQLALPAAAARRHRSLERHVGGEVVVGIRPEHLSLARDGVASTLSVEVDVVEALGSEQLVHFRLDAKRVYAAGVEEEQDAALAAGGSGVARIDPKASVRSGERITLAVQTGELHFFDRASGASLAA